MAGFTTRRIGPCFAAEFEGLDLRKPLSPDDVAAVHAAMDEHAVLVFHDQRLDDAEQLAFSR
ncbi:MAG: taurine dioxygenase, partial [Candidatus Rokuibacteriota bacterium]